MKHLKPTEVERSNVMMRELERIDHVNREARRNRTGKKRPSRWVLVDAASGDLLDDGDRRRRRTVK